MAAILNSAILNSAILDKTLTQTLNLTQTFILSQLDDGSHLEFAILDSAILHKKTSLILLTQLDDGILDFNLMMAAILNSAILLSSSDSLQKHSHSNSDSN